MPPVMFDALMVNKFLLTDSIECLCECETVTGPPAALDVAGRPCAEDEAALSACCRAETFDGALCYDDDDRACIIARNGERYELEVTR